MAQIFPMRPAGPGDDDGHSPLVGTLLALPDPWVLLCDRRIAGADHARPIDVVLVHPEIGVALIDEAPGDPAGALAAFQAFLGEQRFAEFYPGELPVVTLSIAREQLGAIGDHLAAAFEAAPRLTVSDNDWADAVIELLLTPDDLPMASVGGPIPAEEALPPETEPEPPVEPLPEIARPRSFEIPALDTRLEPMMVEWPFAPRDPPRWHGGRVAAAAVGLLLFAGLGLAALNLGSDESTPPSAAVSVQNEAEALVPPLPPAPPPTVAETPPAPPPVPSAPPVVLAAKPLAPLPPAAPKPTPVEPLPQITVSEAAPAPPPPAPAPAATPPAPESPRPAPAHAVPPPTGGARPAAPQRAVAAAPRPTREARLTPTRRPPAEAEAGPPIDASELPPLDRAGGAASAEHVPAALPATSGSGPSTAAANPAPSTRECRPYTAETPIAGRGVAVQGIACRDADGAWRLVSEVPLR